MVSTTDSMGRLTDLLLPIPQKMCRPSVAAQINTVDAARSRNAPQEAEWEVVELMDEDEHAEIVQFTGHLVLTGMEDAWDVWVTPKPSTANTRRSRICGRK